MICLLDLAMCDKPEESKDSTHNCVSDTFLFPSSSMTCDYCSKIVQLKCMKKNDKENQFYGVGNVTNFNPCRKY
jgi:hypothetical protein